MKMNNISDIVLLRRDPIKDYQPPALNSHIDLINKAQWLLRWDYTPNKSCIGVYTQKDWCQTLITKINEISGQIHRCNLKGGVNTVVIHNELLPLFRDLEYFHEDAMQISSRYQVIIDDRLPYNKILVYYESNSNLSDNPSENCGVIIIDNYKPNYKPIMVKNNSVSKYLLITI